MRSKSPEKRGKQKVVRAPTYRIENEYNPEAMPQYFQIAVNILEERNLAWINPKSANIYVIAEIGKKKHKTSIRRHMKTLCSKETFILDIFVNPRDLQHRSLWLAVMEPRCKGSRLLGETSMNLGEIWAQPNHEIFHKWMQLIPMGFLKVDVKIILRSELQVVPVTINDEKLKHENSALAGSEHQYANYVITVYGAFGLPNDDDYQTDKRSGKPPSTFVRVSFCGLAAKTAIQRQTNNPAYCEQISIIEMFPNMNQIINFDICANEGSFNRILGSTQLYLGDISHDGENGFLPTFGPSTLHVYANSNTSTSSMICVDGPFHRGALLVACSVIVPYYQRNLKSVAVQPVAPIRLENLWSFEDFCIYCPIFEVSMLNRRTAGKFCGVAITFGEMVLDDKSDREFVQMTNDIRSRKLHYTGNLRVFQSEHEYGYLDFSNAYPVLQFATRLPDFRFKMYRNNMIYGVVNNLEVTLIDVEKRLRTYDYSCVTELITQSIKALKDAMAIIEKFLDIEQYSSSIITKSEDMMRQYNTILDQKQLTLQKEEIEKIHRKILQRIKFTTIHNTKSSTSSKENYIGSRKIVKLFLADMRIICQELKAITYNSSQGWADIVVWLLNGGSRVAFSKISPPDVIYSVISEQCGKNCGRIQTIYMKPIRCLKHANIFSSECHCIVGKVELLIWMGLYRHKPAFDACLPGLKLKMKDYDMCIKSTALMVECTAFICKAKLKGDNNGLNASRTYLRINALNIVKETKVQCRTLTPVWNQVLKIQRMVFMTPERLTNSPPIVLVEVYNTELSDKVELVGRFQIKPTVSEKPDFESAPKLQWYHLYNGVDNTGQVLMSVQLVQIPERLLKNIIYTSIEQSYVATTASRDLDGADNYIPLPKHLLPISTSYKVDIYWWGFRNINIRRKLGVVLEIEDLCIKSDIIIDKKSSCNFPNGRISRVFEGPINEICCPMLNIRLFYSNTFGRMQYLNTNIVKNPNKYILRWLDKSDRDASLRRTSIISSEFIQVNQQLFVKKNSQTQKENTVYDSCASVKNMESMTKSKYSKWKHLFRQREPDEEEYTLLPIFLTKKESELAPSTMISKQTDWWQKYLNSQKDNNDDENVCVAEKLIIFGSELENQPEFSKFKDWCATLKLYNGKKTGIPERDKQLYCGTLKAGLAIYKWPPSDNKTPVTFSGIELNRGFFDDHPNNDPAKFLIRVYIVKGTNLKTKDFVGNTSPYVLLTCGNKQLGNRNSYLPNKLNPIFGKMYEMRCNLPEDYLLSISLYNYDADLSDELIGCTKIDLEDRIYSKHRALIGLSFVYSLFCHTYPRNDLLKWRDYTKPSTILEELCSKNHLSPPVFIDNSTLLVNGIEYKDSERDISFTSSLERRENLCLNILHKWYTLPVCGYHLVPEHVETRTLYNTNRPGIEQGKLHMWVDIFPLDIGVYIPPPIDITPKETENYELQVTIYTFKDINVGSDILGRSFSDSYIRGWIGFMDLTQNTDVHYQYMPSGKGNFNCRMIFQFQYHPTTREISCRHKPGFTVSQENAPPILNIQLMDYETSSPNECLGSLTLELNAIPLGAKRVDECVLGILDNSKKINLFSVRSLRAWYPMISNDRNFDNTVAKIDLEMNLLCQDIASLAAARTDGQPTFSITKPMCHEKLSNGLCNKMKNLYYGRINFILILVVCLLLVLEIVLALYFELPVIILEYWS